MPNPLFGKITNYEMALLVAKWSGEAFLGVAVLLVFYSFLSTFWLLPIAIAHAVCGYLLRFNLSRVAAVVGLILAILCFLPSFFLPGGRGGLVFGIVIWAAIRGIDATSKLATMPRVQDSPRGT